MGRHRPRGQSADLSPAHDRPVQHGAFSMKAAWLVLTGMFLAAMIYLVHQEATMAKATTARQQPESGASHRLAESAQAKLDHIRENGEREHPDQTPTVLTEDEINDYLASGKVQLP